MKTWLVIPMLSAIILSSALAGDDASDSHSFAVDFSAPFQVYQLRPADRLGVDFRRYVILGACNPPLAYKTLQAELQIGLLLPCNVIVYEADEAGKTVVAAVDAKAMLSVVGSDPTIDSVATEVNEKLRRVIDQI